MQRVTDVSSAEWRWVIVFSGLLVGLTLLPYAWAFASDTPNDHWQFMGILSNPQDGATYFAKINEGERGQWLFTLAHTPEPTKGVAIHEFYLALGHLAAALGLTASLAFHLARITTSFVMYITFYHLGASIWQRLRARRLFFGFIAVGSGLGWLVTLFAPSIHPVDLYVPESIPLYAAFTNPHFPLALAFIALIAATFIGVFRPGYKQTPSFANGGLTLALITLVLTFVQPQAWLPMGVALCSYLLLHVVRTRQLPPTYQIQWVALAVLPALPLVLYDEALVTIDPMFGDWNAQNVTPSGSPLNYIFGFGLLLLVGLPAIWRAVRHFEQDGDRFMLVWLVTNTLLLYAPFNLQRRLVIGMIIPIVYFTVRALEDFWFNRISPRWRDAALLAMFVFIVPSNVFALLLPLVGVTQPSAGLQNYLLIPSDYNHALTWLHDHTTPNSVVLAPPGPSLWIPAFTPARVIYGHPFETLYAGDKMQAVRAWYAGQDCAGLIGQYDVEYVIIGPNDTYPSNAPAPTPLAASATPGTSLGYKGIDGTHTACIHDIGQPVAQFGSVTIYAATPTF